MKKLIRHRRGRKPLARPLNWTLPDNIESLLGEIAPTHWLAQQVARHTLALAERRAA